MHFIYLFTFLLASFVAADTTSSSPASSSSSSSMSTVSPTLVWVTGTNSNGVTMTTQSAYSQEFTSFFSSVAQPSSGSVGIGSVSGTVGKIRSYSHSTVSGAGINVTGRSTGIFCTRILPLLSAIFGLFMF